jgi:hypothetical protein
VVKRHETWSKLVSKIIVGYSKEMMGFLSYFDRNLVESCNGEEKRVTTWRTFAFLFFIFYISVFFRYVSVISCFVCCMIMLWRSSIDNYSWHLKCLVWFYFIVWCYLSNFIGKKTRLVIENSSHILSSNTIIK